MKKKLKIVLAKDQPYMYPEAGSSDAPEVVQKYVEEFRELSDDERAEKPLLYRVLGSGTPAYKLSKKDSKYTDDSVVEGENCRNCEFIYYSLSADKYICSQVSGEIKPKGWCDRWVKG